MVLGELNFQYDITYEDFKVIPRRAVSDKVLREKVFNITKIQNRTDINVDLLQWFTNSLIKSLLLYVQKNLL